MKKIYIATTLIILSSISTISIAQTVFWTETFGSGCNQGQMASGITTTNGTWAVNPTGENDGQANVWYISAKCDGTGSPNCADKNCTNSNQSLHISSNDGLATNDAGCNYDAGGLCSFFSVCVVTNTRAESPLISTVGHNGITLTFDYLSYGDPGKDFASVYYSLNGGTTWTILVAALPQTVCCPGASCTGNNQGQWTNYSVALPAGANNIANLKIGFNWTNNDDGNGQDPSIAIDNVKLTVPGSSPPPVAQIASFDGSGCNPYCINFTDSSTNTPTSWLWTFPGGSPSSSTMQNPSGICYSDSGTFSVKLKVTNSGGSDSVTISNVVHIAASPPTPVITKSGDTLYCSFDSSYTSYQWFDSTALISGATHPYLKISQSGNYNVEVTNAAGCEVADGITVGTRVYSIDNSVSIFPVPASDAVTVTGNWQSGAGELSVYDMLGKNVKQYAVKLDNSIIVNVKTLSQGVYFMQIETDRGRWSGKFVKE